MVDAAFSPNRCFVLMLGLLSLQSARMWWAPHWAAAHGGPRALAQIPLSVPFSNGVGFSSAAEERIVEVESKEEFESCKVGNPIRMYTEGLSTVSLENEGSRYFISSSVESCQNGLKLHVNVQPQSKAVREIKGDDAVNRGVAAEGPKPSSCSHFHQGSPLKWFAMAFICFTISFSGL